MTRGKAKFILIVTVFALIAGAGAILIGAENFLEAGKTQAQPRTLTAEQLLRNGPGKNHYIRLTNVIARTNLIVVQGGDRKTYWEKAYVPLVPAGADAAADDAPQILLISDSTTNRSELDALTNAASFQGVLGAWDATLSETARDLLRQSYPQMDPAKCYVLSYNATPPTKAGSLICMGIGVFLLIGMVLLGILGGGPRAGAALAPPPIKSFGAAPLAPYPGPAPLQPYSGPPALPPEVRK